MKKLLLVSCLLTGTMYSAEGNRLVLESSDDDRLVQMSLSRLNEIYQTVDSLKVYLRDLTTENHHLAETVESLTQDVRSLTQEVDCLRRLLPPHLHQVYFSRMSSRSNSRSNSRASCSPCITREDLHPMIRPFLNPDPSIPIKQQMNDLKPYVEGLIKKGRLDPRELSFSSASILDTAVVVPPPIELLNEHDLLENEHDLLKNDGGAPAPK